MIRIDLIGPGVGVTTTVMNVMPAVVLCVLWVRPGPQQDATPREDLLRYAAGTVATVLVLGTVLSPQYVVWLIPLVPLVGGRRGTAAILLFIVAAGLTNVWIPEKYFAYQEGLAAGPASILLPRNLALARRGPGTRSPPHSTVLGSEQKTMPLRGTFDELF